MLPVGGDNILIVLLKTGLQGDTTLMPYHYLSDLLAGTGNVEANFTNYSRKVLASADITRTVNTSTHITTVDIADQTWASAGGATNNNLGALLTCYRPSTASTDNQILLLTKHDYTQSTTGQDLKATIPSIGTARWSAT